MKKFTLLSIIVITLFASCKKEVSKKEVTPVKLEKGLAAPEIGLEDINGYLITLKGLKGKLVYIDVWATWCIPCLKEVPSLQKLEEHFKGKDIEFVSVCIKDKKNLWEKMVKEKGFSGIQVFDPESKSAFIKQYKIESVPRFILIDKEGKLIEANALPPSDPKLKEQLEKFL